MREQKQYHVAKKIEELKEITNKKTLTSTFTPATERITVHEKSCHQFESLLKLENVNILTLWHCTARRSPSLKPISAIGHDREPIYLST